MELGRDSDTGGQVLMVFDNSFLLAFVYILHVSGKICGRTSQGIGRHEGCPSG